MTFTSEVFKNNETIPIKYTCEGAAILPPFTIKGVSVIAKSLAIIMEDPDAPTGVWDHWIKWNISSDVTSIKEGKEPKGLSGLNTGGTLVYSSPCPPYGTHRYVFKLYALHTMLDLPEGSSKKELEKAMMGHILEHVELTGFYTRTK